MRLEKRKRITIGSWSDILCGVMFNTTEERDFGDKK